jgi:DNA polymerase II small subunit
MDQKEILNFCLEQGILLDKEVLNLISEATDFDAARLMIERIKEDTHQKVITKKVFTESIKHFSSSELLDEKQKGFEKLRIRLGLELEISKEISMPPEIKKLESIEEKKFSGVKVYSYPTTSNKKVDVESFTNYFRSRLLKMKPILQSHSNLKNLVSINKISGDRQGISIIGMISDKRVTKNGNILLTVEDLTGSVRVLINQNKKDLYKKGEEVTLDAVIGVSGSGNKEIIFANDFIFPDSTLPERKKSPFEEYALFIGDIHYGSKLFLKDQFNKFIDYLNGKISNTPEVSKIKYLFIIGDVVAGVGVYPEQESFLDVVNLEDQYKGFAEMLSRIRKDIAIIINPGNHDGVRLMEPQPLFDKKYAWPLYNLENVMLATNPCKVNIGEKNGFPGIDVLMYHGFSYFYYADNIPSLIQAHAANAPEKIMTYLLMNRHLAPTHSSVQYYPLEEDPLVIDNVPDIFFSGHTHKCGITFYNNTLIISGATWEDLTPFQEKMGNQPDFCKVPILNLKTGAVKILDFEDK